MKNKKILWKEYKSYQTAMNCTNCLYVFRKNGKPLYIGKAKKFGGPRGRYAYGYRYLIEALLKSGCKLYIAKINSRSSKFLDNCERTLIKKYRNHLVNKKNQEPKKEIVGIRLPWRVSK
jgi:hypothetical protein